MANENEAQRGVPTQTPETKKEIEKILHPEQMPGEVAEQASTGESEESAPVATADQEVPSQVVSPKVTAPASVDKSEELQEVEGVMEEELRPVYDKMSDEEKTAFKESGESTAKEIEGLLHAVKVKANSILKLLKKWLRMIPGVNKLFLEQEAKIMTDKIVHMNDNEQGEK